MDPAERRSSELGPPRDEPTHDARFGQGQQYGSANVQHNWFLPEANSATPWPIGSSTAPLPAADLVPRQLPAHVPELVGRDGELRRMDRLLADDPHAGPGGTVAISAIAGTPGVGKTSLAVAWGHRQRHHFVDGDLFVNLRGYGPGRPVAPTEALDLFLRALNVPPKRIPGDLDAQVALYRTLLHDKRMLIVLDNAFSTDQVVPLLPGSRGCVVLVTSRKRLLGLVADNDARVTVELLSPAESFALMRTIVGRERADAEPEALARLAKMCAYLPLALRVAGERAAARPRAKLASLVADLGRRARLLGLSLDDDEDSALRAVFSWSYVALPPALARTFRLLGWHAGPDVSTGAAAALIGLPEVDARQHLEELARVHLIEERAEDRYGFHDLLAEYARERSESEDGEQERLEALRRMLAWYLHTAQAANNLIMPQRGPIPIAPRPAVVTPRALTGYDDALAWCEAERTNLVLATRQAADHDLDDIAWQLPVFLRGFFNLRKHWKDWITTHEIALTAASRAGDWVGMGWVHQGLGTASRQLGRIDEAIRHHGRALQLRRATGDRSWIASALDGLGSAHLEAGRADEAIGHYEEALALREEIGHVHGQAWSLHNLAACHQHKGDLDRAVALYRRALPLRREVGDRWGEGATLHRLGTAHAEVGDPARAIDCFEQARVLQDGIGDRWGVACSLRGLGDVHHGQGEQERAIAAWREALRLFQELGDPQADEVQKLLDGAAG